MSRISDEQFERCVDGLYGALSTPASLVDAFSSVRPMFEATGSAYIQIDGNGGLRRFIGDGHDPAVQSMFVERFEKIDPIKPLLAASKPGWWFGDDRMLDPKFSRQSEYVNVFAKSAGIRWFRGGKVFEDARGSTYFSIHRPPDAAPFDDDTLKLLDLLLPHLARVSRLTADLEETLPALASTQAAINLLRTGICVVDASCRLLYANPAAEALLASPCSLQVKNGRLSSKRTETHSKLWRAIALATIFPRQASAFSANPEAPVADRLQVRAVPLDARLPLGRHGNGDLVLLFVAGGVADLHPAELGQLF
ncbi:MAG: hypothetical protein ACREMY_09975, partial [bacterium]